MSSETNSLGDKLAKVARVILLGGIAVVLALIVVSPRGSSSDPLTLEKAHANIAAAPGYLMLTMSTGGNSKLYINDTNKQVICIYEVTGDKLRLVSARKYDHDSGVFDMSIPMGGKVPEGGNGLNREQTKAYGDIIKKGFEDFQKRNKLN